MGRRDEGFAGFGVPLVSHGAVGGEAGGVHGAPPPHPEFGVSASQAVRGVCLGVGGVPHQLWWGGSKDSAAKSGGAAGNPLRGCWAATMKRGLTQPGSGTDAAVWRRSLRTGTPPTPKIWNRGLTGLALGVCVCVWVWVGSHTNCTGVVGCACPRFVATLKPRYPHAQV